MRWDKGRGRKKRPEDYEAEATRLANGCLIHPTALARRVYRARHGRPAPGLCVCHTCDTPNCIEDRHHFLGTHKDNAQDKMRKGRWGGGRKPPLSDEAKQHIRTSGWRQWELSAYWERSLGVIRKVQRETT